MTGDQGGDVPVGQGAPAGHGVHAAGRDLHAPDARVAVSGASGVQVGEQGTQVNHFHYYPGGDPGAARGGPAGRLLEDVTDPVRAGGAPAAAAG
ncbi:MAG TPA: hypothetical protein VGG25_19525 [Streptosporangiaceae bacterium]